jgi:hypothetical protein
MASQFLRDGRVFRIFEGPTETMQVFLGSSILNRPQDLTNYLKDRFNAEQIANRLITVSEQVENQIINNAFLNEDEITRRNWAYFLIGELAVYGILLACTENAFIQTRSERHRNAMNWAEMKFKEVSRKALVRTESDSLFLSVKEIEAINRGYIDAIGNIEQTMPGGDYQQDAMLRLTQTQSSPQPQSGIAVKSEYKAKSQNAAQVSENNGYHAEKPADLSQPSTTIKKADKSTIIEVSRIQGWMLDWMSANLQISRNRLSASRPFAEYGMDSIKAIEFAQDLE